MRISYPLCVVVVVVAMLHVRGGQAAAQVEVTAVGSYISIPGGAWGIGVQIHVVIHIILFGYRMFLTGFIRNQRANYQNQ